MTMANVYCNKRRKLRPWIVTGSRNNVRYYIGSYATEEEARIVAKSHNPSDFFSRKSVFMADNELCKLSRKFYKLLNSNGVFKNE